MRQATREEAIALAEGKFWEGMSARDIALFQMQQHLLCMDFPVFHKAISEALGRDVYTHELVDREGLTKELMGEKAAPTFEEIINMIPAEKRIIINL